MKFHVILIICLLLIASMIEAIIETESVLGPSSNQEQSTQQPEKSTAPVGVPQVRLFDSLVIIRTADGFRIIEFEDLQKYQHYESIMFACPIEDEYEAEKITEPTPKLLIIKEWYKHYNESIIPKCGKKYEPSLLYDRSTDTFDIGYEIYSYYEKYSTLMSEIDKYMESALHREVVTKEWMVDFSKIRWRRSHPTEIRSNHIFWLSALPIKFNMTRRSAHFVVQTFYSYRAPHEQVVSCSDDFKLGIELFQETDIAALYTPENQNELLKDYQFIDDMAKQAPQEGIHDVQAQSESTSSMQSATPENGTNSDKPENQTKFQIPTHLIHQQLASTKDYREHGLQPATCTYLDGAPMWNVIVEGSWKKINEFIKAKASLFYKLEEITGTYGVLELPLKNSKLSTIFLSPKQKLYPVPSLFWKFLKYSLYSKNHLRHLPYFIIIVVHNYPTDPKTGFQMICPKDVCRSLGWPLTNNDFKTGRSYCCRVTKELLKKLGIMGDHEGIDLNLKAVDVEMDDKFTITKTLNVTDTIFIDGDDEENLEDVNNDEEKRPIHPGTTDDDERRIEEGRQESTKTN